MRAIAFGELLRLEHVAAPACACVHVCHDWALVCVRARRRHMYMCAVRARARTCVHARVRACIAPIKHVPCPSHIDDGIRLDQLIHSWYTGSLSCHCGVAHRYLQLFCLVCSPGLLMPCVRPKCLCTETVFSIWLPLLYRALGQKVYKKAMKYIYSEFAVLSEVLHANGVHLALSGHGSITSGTGGQNFWNVVHTDSDLGLTILVAFGAVSGGGEFVHPQVGVAHDVRPGCIMVVNPKHAHATAEFQLAAGEHRRMVAFFTKEAVVCGAGTAMAAAHRRGLEVWVPGKRSRKQK